MIYKFTIGIKRSVNERLRRKMWTESNIGKSHRNASIQEKLKKKVIPQLGK